MWWHLLIKFTVVLVQTQVATLLFRWKGLDDSCIVLFEILLSCYKYSQMYLPFTGCSERNPDFTQTKSSIRVSRIVSLVMMMMVLEQYLDSSTFYNYFLYIRLVLNLKRLVLLRWFHFGRLWLTDILRCWLLESWLFLNRQVAGSQGWWAEWGQGRFSWQSEVIT